MDQSRRVPKLNADAANAQPLRASFTDSNGRSWRNAVGNTDDQNDEQKCCCCFNSFPNETLPTCTTSFGRHAMCIPCLKDQLRRKVMKNPSHTHTDRRIDCRFPVCNGKFTLDHLSFENARKRGQKLAFREAKSSGKEVERCKECTYFITVRDPEDHPLFLCPQCNSTHCRECGEEWDAEHIRMNACAGAFHKARKEEERRRAEEELKRAQVRKAAETRRKEEEKRKLDETRRKQTEQKNQGEDRIRAQAEEVYRRQFEIEDQLAEMKLNEQKADRSTERHQCPERELTKEQVKTTMSSQKERKLENGTANKSSSARKSPNEQGEKKDEETEVDVLVSVISDLINTNSRLEERISELEAEVKELRKCSSCSSCHTSAVSKST